MGRKELAEEIVDFFIEYNLMENSDTTITKQRIEAHLEHSWFVEYLIHIVLVRAKYIRNMDKDRLEKILTELEKLRFDVEYTQ